MAPIRDVKVAGEQVMVYRHYSDATERADKPYKDCIEQMLIIYVQFLAGVN